MFALFNALPIIQAPLLQGENWLCHGFGIKDISIERYLDALGLAKIIVPETKQPHGNRVHVLQAEKQSSVLVGDAFLTDRSSLVCWVRSADCIPILLADSKHHVVGAVHAGWRGTAEKVILKTVEVMVEQWQISPANLKVALGPAIGGRCYPVGTVVAQAFSDAQLNPGDWIEKAWNDRWFLDLAFANLELLLRAGVPRERIYLSLACTACDTEKFASYRREGEKRGEQVSFIVKKN